MKKKRLDQVLLELLPHFSRQQIQSFIIRGRVSVDGLVVTKPGSPVDEQAQITYAIEEPRYVSRAGFKLERALDHFGIDVTGMVVLDAGISTGGFTDCLLQRDAAKVFGVDVGYGQVHEKIRHHERLVLLERTNLRFVTRETIDEMLDLVTLDLSFISVLKVIPVIEKLLKKSGMLIVLIKPQFEAARHQIGRGGIVRDPSMHQEIVERVQKGIEFFGFVCRGVIESPILGSTGNKEFLGLFVRNDADIVHNP